MTAVDHEKGKILVNPFIGVSKEGRNLTCYLNTSTFSECQDELLHPLDRQRDELSEKNQLYVVEAIVGEYNGSPGGGLSNVLKTVSITRDPRSTTLLGYLSEADVKKYLPNTFATLNSK